MLVIYPHAGGSLQFIEMLKMRKLDHLFEEMMLFTNRNLYIIYTATIKQSKIGQKSDVTTVAMATMTIQDGRYFCFERILL